MVPEVRIDRLPSFGLGSLVQVMGQEVGLADLPRAEDGQRAARRVRQEAGVVRGGIGRGRRRGSGTLVSMTFHHDRKILRQPRILEVETLGGLREPGCLETA